MSKDDDDTLDVVNSLMNMIGGAKKKDVQTHPLRHPRQNPGYRILPPVEEISLP